MLSLFKNRTIGSYLKLGAAVLILVLTIVYLIIDKTMIAGKVSFEDKSSMVILFLLLGVGFGIGSFFLDYGLDIVAPILYSLGFGIMLTMACFPITDLATGVGFFCNSLNYANTLTTVFIIFLVLYFITIVTSIVSSYMKSKKA